MLGAMGCEGRCGGASTPAPGPQSLSEAERRALPGTIVFLSERAGQKDVWRVTPDGK
ncbi:MAG: tolB protein precursor protein, partial [Myxococcaceae bacterium]